MPASLRALVVLILGLGSSFACGGETAPQQTAAVGAAGSAGSGPSVVVTAGSAAGIPSAGSAAVSPVVVVRPVPGPAQPCTGKPGMLRGKSTQTLMAAGLSRTFIYHAPSTLNPNVPAPLVFIPHGYTMTADQMYETTRYSDLADKEGFIAVFLNGQAAVSGPLDGPWNVGAPDCSSSLGFLPLAKGDDQALLDEVLKFAEADQCLDRAHVFMNGFSMGGYLSNETGCLRPDIRAVAPHSGGTHDLAGCITQHKPAMILHFQGDPLIPYMCGVQARDRWVARNGCQATGPDVTQVKGGTCEYYKGCPADGQVAFCSFTIPPERMSGSLPGHAWSGGSITANSSFGIPETESATQLSWDFFRKYAW